MSPTLPPALLIAMLALHMGFPALAYFFWSAVRARRFEAIVQAGLLVGFAAVAIGTYEVIPALWWPGAEDQLSDLTTKLLMLVATGAALDGAGRGYRKISAAKKVRTRMSAH